MKINIMKYRIGLLVYFLLCIGCSEGDLIAISVDIEGGDLQNCTNENDNTFVFFVNDPEIDRSLSVNFTSTSFEINPAIIADISLDEPTLITLNATNNQFLYREFNTSIRDINYFCSSVPVSNVRITQELVSSNGTVEISYEITDATNPNQTIYSRTVTIRDFTLVGNGIELRRELLVLGTDSIMIPN